MLTLRADGPNRTSLDLNQKRISVGRDRGNDLVIDDDSVSGFHAELFVENDRLEVVDLGSTNGTWLDEQPVHGRQPVNAWQRLRFGSVVFELIDDQARRPTRAMPAVGAETAAPPAPASHAPEETATGPIRAFLQPTESENTSDSVTVHDTLTIGRAPDNQLVLSSEQVSSHHARLEWQDGNMTVTDLDSTNGTWVNGQRVHQQVLKTGDRVAFDEIAFTFRRQGQDLGSKTRLNPAIGNSPSADTAPRPAIATPAPAAAPTRTIPAAQATMPADSPRPSPSAPTAVQAAVPPSATTGPVHSSSSVDSDPDRARFWPFVALSRYAEFSGRSRRKEYWWYFLFYSVIFYGTLLIDMTLGLYDPMRGQAGVLIWIVMLVFLLPTLAVQIRRLHDTDRSGWWILLGLIPVVGFLILIVFYILNGTPGPNRYGADPQGRGG